MPHPPPLFSPPMHTQFSNAPTACVLSNIERCILTKLSLDGVKFCGHAMPALKLHCSTDDDELDVDDKAIFFVPASLLAPRNR